MFLSNSYLIFRLVRGSLTKIFQRKILMGDRLVVGRVTLAH